MDKADISHSNMRSTDFQEASFIGTKFSHSDLRKSQLQKAWFENVEADEVMVYGKKPWLEGSKAELDIEQIKAPNWDD